MCIRVISGGSNAAPWPCRNANNYIIGSLGGMAAL